MTTSSPRLINSWQRHLRYTVSSSPGPNAVCTFIAARTISPVTTFVSINHSVPRPSPGRHALPPCAPARPCGSDSHGAPQPSQAPPKRRFMNAQRPSGIEPSSSARPGASNCGKTRRLSRNYRMNQTFQPQRKQRSRGPQQRLCVRRAARSKENSVFSVIPVVQGFKAVSVKT
jgi:hypothetical protein